MADVENQQEPVLPVKRKPDLCCQEQDNIPNKAQKLQPDNSSAFKSRDGENHVSELDHLDSSAEEKVDTKSLNSEDKTAGSEAKRDEKGGADEDRGPEKEKNEADDVEVDRKGKGILRDDKGKGKLIAEDESEDDEDSDDDDDDDDDEEDSSDDGNESDGESDLSDDPLAEVDLDNILSSRTRRRAMQPGLYISDEIGNNEDDDSDDSDA